MEDQEIWDLMGDLENVGLGDSLTKAYLINGFYEDGEGYTENEILTVNVVKGFIETYKSDGIDLFFDLLKEPELPHTDPLISCWGGFSYLIIKGDLTKVRSVEEKLRKDFIIEKEIELKDYKKFVLSGTGGLYGAMGSTGTSGTVGPVGSTGYAGSSRVIYSTSGMGGSGGSFSTSGVTVTLKSNTTSRGAPPIMIQTSLKIEMPIKELKDPTEDSFESYGHPLWEKIKGKFGF